MPAVAVTLPYFDFFPELKAELAAKYPGARFARPGPTMQGAELIEFVNGCEVALIGPNRFTDEVCRALPRLKVVSLCTAGVDHIDPEVLKRHGIRMWWAPGINRMSVSELALCYMVFALRRLQLFSSVLRRGEWKGPMGFGADLRGRTVGIHGV
ncbi:MAG: hypothetical protein IT514_03630, partial [Burkholderiales bacterium]|nr:hypothetical protein [Burkholderiales bacterium]